MPIFVYYLVKPLIPRPLQISLRRMLARKRLPDVKDVWPIDESCAKRPPGWDGWPDGKRFAFILTHDVETIRGQEKCRQLAAIDLKFGFRSGFYFVPKRYEVSADLQRDLVGQGFEVGVHGLYHDGFYFSTGKVWKKRAALINEYLAAWKAVGFRTPSMIHNLEQILDLDIEYDASTFDTDPFEPQPDGAGTIFPFWVPPIAESHRGYVELPYTLPQDFTVFVILKESGPSLWKEKLRWIAENGGMALMIVHPDYMSFDGQSASSSEYPADYYVEFLEHVRTEYKEQYWNALPREVARRVRSAVQGCDGNKMMSERKRT